MCDLFVLSFPFDTRKENVVLGKKNMEPKKRKNSDDTNQSRFKSEKVLLLLNDFRKGAKLCDVKLLVDDGIEYQYPAHKCVLASFSPFFEAMFLGDFLESKKSVVKLSGVDASVMDVILDYAYGTEIEITSSNAESILQAAHFFQVEELVEICCRCLERNITAGRCFYLNGLAEVYGRPSLVKKTTEFVLKNFDEVSHEVDFLELDSDKLISIISNDALNVYKEDYVFEAVQRWFYYKKKERKDQLLEVLRHVRMLHIDPESLKKLVNEFPALKSKSGMKLVNEVLFYYLAPKSDGKKELTAFTTRERDVWMQDLQVWVVFGETADTHKQKIICINEKMEIVSQIPLPPTAITSCHTSEKELFSVSDDWKCIYKYDFSSQEWQPISQMSSAREKFGFAELGGVWYAVGGFLPGTNVATSIVEQYDPSSNVWTNVSSMPETFVSLGVTSGGGFLFAVGGMNTDPTRAVLLEYDSSIDQWTRLEPTTFPLIQPRVTFASNSVFLWSLYDKRLVYLYLLPDDEWLTNWILKEKVLLVSSFATFIDSTYVCICGDSKKRVIKQVSFKKNNSAKEVASFRNFWPESIHRLMIRIGPSHHRFGKEDRVIYFEEKQGKVICFPLE